MDLANGFALSICSEQARSYRYADADQSQASYQLASVSQAISYSTSDLEA